jgi:hypothetical protein
MATFKIKLEDKAAFLNRLEKQDVAVDSSKIKDNKLEGYFEIDIIDPKQLEVAKTILKQSPKINTIKEMKKSLTKDELKEMIRQELTGVLNENGNLNESALTSVVDAIKSLDPSTLGYLATVLGITGGGIAIAKKLNAIQDKTGSSATPNADKGRGLDLEERSKIKGNSMKEGLWDTALGQIGTLVALVGGVTAVGKLLLMYSARQIKKENPGISEEEAKKKATAELQQAMNSTMGQSAGTGIGGNA